MDEPRLILRRTYTPKQTEGRLYVFNDRNGIIDDLYSLELPFVNNQKFISCIPEDEYEVIKHISPTFGECFWIQDVPKRSEILMHAANYVGTPNPRTGKSDLKGCIAPGLQFSDLNGDGIREVISSRLAMTKLLRYLPNRFVIRIEKNGSGF